jgi:hypothetical protein
MALDLFPVDYYNPQKASTLDTVENAVRAMRGLGRGYRNSRYLEEYSKIGRGEPPNIQSLSESFARRAASKHNKNVLALVLGDTGTGKSMSILSLALGCAEWMAKLLGGTPQQYFNFEEGVAIIDPEALQEKLSSLKRHQIVICDDAGPSYDARNSMTKDSKELGYILQTCRTQNNIILFSSINAAMLDINSRRIAQFMIETKEVRHDKGLTFLACFHLIRDIKANRIFYKYPTKSHYTITRYYTGLPPTKMKKMYDKVRELQAGVIMQMRNQRKEKEAEKAEKTSKDRWTDKEFAEKMAQFADAPTTLEDMSVALETAGITIRRYMKRCGYKFERIPKTHKSVVVKATT